MCFRQYFYLFVSYDERSTCCSENPVDIQEKLIGVLPSSTWTPLICPLALMPVSATYSYINITQEYGIHKTVLPEHTHHDTSISLSAAYRGRYELTISLPKCVDRSRVPSSNRSDLLQLTTPAPWLIMGLFNLTRRLLEEQIDLVKCR